MEHSKKKPGRVPGAHKVYPHAKLARMTPEQLAHFNELVKARKAERPGYLEADLLRDLVDEEADRWGLG